MFDGTPIAENNSRQTGEIVGRSQALRGILDRIMMVAGADTSVLVVGETGTGKELVARAIHRLSRRNGRPLISVNCAALPAGLIESELFGHERGAFTGAVARRTGRFERAHEGTIFLDEIGELPAEAQAKLLRVLETRELQRVGSSRTITVNVRVIAATNRALASAVEANEFRPDLYYRLNVFRIVVPPLRERTEDILPLARHFLEKAARKLQRIPPELTQETIDCLTAYPWPGNVRELESVIERAVVLSQGAVITLEDDLRPLSDSMHSDTDARAMWMPRAVRAVTHDRDRLFDALKEADGNQTKAARLLGIGRTTLWRRLKAYRASSDTEHAPETQTPSRTLEPEC